MVKNFFFMMLIFLNFCYPNLFSQTNIENEQEFLIENFYVVSPTSGIAKSKITLKFDVKLSIPIKDYYKKPYWFKMSLITKDSIVVYESKESIKVLAKPYFDDKSLSITKGLSVEIPFSDINMDVGKHSVLFRVQAENDYKDFGNIYLKQLLINVPKTYNYSEQQFTASNIEVSTDKEYKGLKGIKIMFDCNLKFQDFQIKGINDNRNLGNYYFLIELIDKNSGDIVGYLKDNVNVSIIHSDKIFKGVILHLPYNKINLQKGRYNLKLNIYAKHKNGMLNFGKLISKDVTITQPVLYYCVLNVNQMIATYKIYDVSSVFGRVFSKKTSEAGKGYPDVYWVAKTGGYIEYSSGINKNSFSLFPGKASFYISDEEPVSIVVYDHDITSFDDLIGRFIIKNRNGNFYKNYSDVFFKGIDRANFMFSKIEMPYIKTKKIITKAYKYKGVSGVKINLEYSCSKIPDDDMISIFPVFKNSLRTNENFNYIDLSDSNQVIEDKSNIGNVNIFIPYYEIPDSSYIGFELQTSNTKINLGNIISNSPVIPVEFSDSKISVSGIFEILKQNIYGIEFNILHEIPENYFINNNSFKSKIKISNDGKVVKDTVVFINDINSTKSIFFIPYYKLNSGNIKVFEDLSIYGTDFLIGRSNQEKSFKLPEINEYSINKVVVKTKDIEFYDELFVVILYDNVKVFKSKSLKTKNEIVVETSNLKVKAYSEDKFSISIYGKDSYGISSEIYKKDVKFKQLNSGKIKLKSHRDIKRIKIISN